MGGIPFIMIGIFLLITKGMCTSLATGESNSVVFISHNITSSLDLIANMGGGLMIFIGVVATIISLFNNEYSITSVDKEKQPAISQEPIAEHKKDTLAQYMEDISHQHILQLVREIVAKEKELSAMVEIKNNLKLSEDLKKIKTDYLLKILYQYLEVPKDLREQSINNQPSAQEMTIAQLHILKNRLLEIEREMLEVKNYRIRANERFLKSRFNTQEENLLELEKE